MDRFVGLRFDLMGIKLKNDFSKWVIKYITLI